MTTTKVGTSHGESPALYPHDRARTTGPAGLRKDQNFGESCGNQTCVKAPRDHPQTSLTLSSSLVSKASIFTLIMSTEKLTIDSDGYVSRRRGPGPGPIAFTSLVQLLTASMSVIIIVLAIQQGTHLIIEEVSVRKSTISDYQKIVADLEKEVAVMKTRLEALEAKTNNAQVTGDVNSRPQAEPDKSSTASRSVSESYASTESADVPAHHQRQKRAANSVTWPAGAGAVRKLRISYASQSFCVSFVNAGIRTAHAPLGSVRSVVLSMPKTTLPCLQGPPGRDGRDGMPGRDCPCGTKATEIDELQRKCEDLEQRVSDLENTTETTPTPMPCSGDTCNLPSSCTEVAGRSGFDNQAFYVIDPDGPGRGALPMVVQCDMEGQTDLQAAFPPARVMSAFKYVGPWALAFNDRTTYNGAVSRCSLDGGTLAIPRDSTTNEFLIDLKNGVDRNAWFRFGLTDVHQEGVWMWDDGVPLGDFRAWGPGQPSNRIEDCAEYFPESWPQKNTWNDGPCTGADRKFICQLSQLVAPEYLSDRLYTSSWGLGVMRLSDVLCLVDLEASSLYRMNTPRMCGGFPLPMTCGELLTGPGLQITGAGRTRSTDRKTITLIGHDSEARTHVDGVEAPGSYSKDVTYWNSMDQVRAVVDQSSLCKQLIKYECHHSHIWDSNGTPFAWWVTWDGRQADYWGGASPGSGKCACGQTGTCSGRCNCNANDFTWREDSGFLSHKDDLPVTQLRFGDAGEAREEGYYTLGKLICYP
ncbi:hypothetical protein Bbelb_399650 [Branchiostoma belcheri]|nr:hypothetical protein Bbelb_399650 [Branchiostoma belcheri]